MTIYTDDGRVINESGIEIQTVYGPAGGTASGGLAMLPAPCPSLRLACHAGPSFEEV